MSQVGAALMGDTAGTSRVIRPKHGGICQQNTHFNMYARTSKPQEGFTCKDSHAKCFKTTNSSAKLYRGAMYRGWSFENVFPSFSVVFPLLRNLEIFSQESKANSTEISIYKTQFLTCHSEQKGKGRFFIKTLLQKCFKTANFDRLLHIIPWSRSESRKCVPNSNHEVFVVISFRGFLYLCWDRCWCLKFCSKWFICLRDLIHL